VTEFIVNNWRSGVEILILWVVLYQLWRVFSVTRGAKILCSVVLVLAVVTVIAYLLKLEVIVWILVHSAVGIAAILVILFQSEIRLALTRLGNDSWFSFSKVQKLEFTEELHDAVVKLSNKRIGALIAIEREMSLKEYAENGVKIDAEFSPELTVTIFFPLTALHDGGVIVSKNRLAHAGCVFPLSQNALSDRTLGLRHRAAVGLSEETDAVAIVVSEETGNISIAIGGELERNLSGAEFKSRIEKIFIPDDDEKDEDEADDDPQLDSEVDGLDSSDSDMVSD